jgi:hypothetical protein
MERSTAGAGLIAALGWKILFYITTLYSPDHTDLKEEARLAAFGKNASHFRTFLDD